MHSFDELSTALPEVLKACNTLVRQIVGIWLDIKVADSYCVIRLRRRPTIAPEGGICFTNCFNKGMIVFNFLAGCDEISIDAVTNSLTVATPNFKALFGSWYVLAVPD